MPRASRPLAASLALLVPLAVAVPAAPAALPRKGATYFGTVGEKSVTVKISKTNPRKGRYTFDCGSEGGPVGEFFKLSVKPDGRFFGRDGGGVVETISSLKGRFKTRDRASATLELGICGKGGKLTLKRRS